MKFPLVQVHWHDAASHGGWRSLKEYQEITLAPVVSVGYQITKGKTITLVQSLSPSSMADSITIPKGWIVKIEKLGTITYPIKCPCKE